MICPKCGSENYQIGVLTEHSASCPQCGFSEMALTIINRQQSEIELIKKQFDLAKKTLVKLKSQGYELAEKALQKIKEVDGASKEIR